MVLCDQPPLLIVWKGLSAIVSCYKRLVFCPQGTLFPSAWPLLCVKELYDY